MKRVTRDEKQPRGESRGGGESICLTLLKAWIGVVLEEQNLHDRFTVRQHLAVSCWIYGLPLACADQVLELVHLQDPAEEPVRAFSHGSNVAAMVDNVLTSLVARSVELPTAAWNRRHERTLRMLPLIYTTPAYTTAFVGVVVLSRIPETILLARRSRHDPTARKADRGSLVVMSIVTGGGVILALVLAAIWMSAAIPWLRPQVTIAGIAVFLLGAALRWWSIITLGRYFTADVEVRSTQSVVHSGPYRLVRHPSYTAILIMLLSLGLALANWASIVVLLAGGLIGLGYRVSVEERALAEALGKPYVDYMRHTQRFIPFLF